eukprot:Rmarinus@m.19940
MGDDTDTTTSALLQSLLSKMEAFCISESSSINRYEVIGKIGEGAYADVFLVREKGGNKMYALKQMVKEKLIKIGGVERSLRERLILSYLKEQPTKSPFLIGLEHAFGDVEQLYLVLELVKGGDMYSHMHKRAGRRFDEDTACFYLAELVLALEHLHNHNILYRDIKPENILLGTDGHIRLADFGFGRRFDEKEISDMEVAIERGEMPAPTAASTRSPSTPPPDNGEGRPLGGGGDDDDGADGPPRTATNAVPKRRSRTLLRSNSIVGTPTYLPPEILQRLGHGVEADYWGLGMLLYEMVVGLGYTPFAEADTDNTTMYVNIVTKPLSLPSYAQMRDDTKDLLTKLLEKDPEKRLGHGGIEEIMNHPFFKGIDWDKLRKMEVEAPLRPPDKYAAF